jgi:signal transduction histidine kinase
VIDDPMSSMITRLLRRASPSGDRYPVRLLDRLKIKQKLTLVLALSGLSLLAAVVLGGSILYQKMVSDREEQTKQLVEVARGIVQSWYDKAQSGSLTQAEAQAGAVAALRPLRYGSDGYFAINRYDGLTVLHANRPQLEGQHRLDVTDADGVPHVRLQIDVAKRGGGFVYFRFPRIGGKEAVPKVYYATAFEPWEWVIGSGVYIDDIDGEFRANFTRLALIAAGIFAVATLCAYSVNHNISASLGRLKANMERLAAGDLTVDIVEADRRDEMGEMGKAMRVFKDNAVAAQQLQAEKEKRRELEIMVAHADRVDAIGRLAGGIAHDLNNALVPVLAMTKSVMSRFDKDSREYTKLDLVLMGANRARELVQQVLAFARKQTIEKREFDLAQVVSDGIRMLRASVPATIKLVSTIEPVPVVYGDGGQLNQVLVNLVSNGAQAIGERPGIITVVLRAKNPQQVRLSVSDTGSGMDEDTKAHIFEPFFTTKGVGEGTGLGLSVVHGIVTSHGGTITVESRPGEGTRVDVILPATRRKEASVA